jgi:Leucine-rich repeat (LRR) protein
MCKTINKLSLFLNLTGFLLLFISCTSSKIVNFDKLQNKLSDKETLKVLVIDSLSFGVHSYNDSICISFYKNLEQFKAIEDLSISNCACNDKTFDGIIIAISGMYNLKRLHLNHVFDSINAKNIILDKLFNSIKDKKINFLSLDDNNISELPQSLGELKDLEILNLSDNRIDSLPNSIGNLIHLKFLNLSFNSDIKYVKRKNEPIWWNPIIENCYVKSLPESISLLKDNLWYLDLRFTCFNFNSIKLGQLQILLPSTCIFLIQEGYIYNSK